MREAYTLSHIPGATTLDEKEGIVKARVLSPVYLLLMASALLLSPLLAPAEALHFLGGADIGKYCRDYAGADTEAGLEAQNAYGWICKDKAGRKLAVSISVTQACRDTNGDPKAIDVLRDYYNPYSWDCYGNAIELGDVNFAGYCKHLGV
jgi:hypothetical protein